MPMNPDEQRLIGGLFERTKGAATAPRDPDAEKFIADQIKAQPHAAYVLTQAVIVQEQALESANQRLQQLEGQVAQMQQQLQAAQQAPPQASGGMFGGLFGRSQPPAPGPMARPAAPGMMAAQPPAGGPWGNTAPQGAPQGGPWAQQPQASAGGGFLKGALATAAGVAGGALLFEGIRGAMGGGGLFGGGSSHGSGLQHASNQGAAPPIESQGGIGDASFDQPGGTQLASSGIGDSSFESDRHDTGQSDFGDAGFDSE